MIGLLERHGLKERAQAWIAKIHSATAGRLLIVYLFVREATAALGLTSLGGHPQMVRLLLAPMAEGRRKSALARCRAMYATACARCRRRPITSGCSSAKIFLRLRRDHLHAQLYAGVGWDPDRTVAYCPVGIPTAICAFLIHAARLWRLDRHLQRELDRINAGQAKGGAA